MESMEHFSSVRDRIRIRIEKRIESLQNGYRQNIGLVGLPGIGKTHFLCSMFKTLTGRSHLVPFFLQAEKLSFDCFLESWIGALLSGLFLSQNITVPKNFSSLLQAAEFIVPKTTEKIRNLKKLVRQERNVAAVKELFSLARILAEETKKNVILMIDEFQALGKLPIPDPFALLGKEMMVDTHTLYFVTSSQPQRAKEIFHDKLSLLFGNFEVIDMVPFSFSETVEVLTSRLPGFLFSPLQKKFMIRMTDGHPAYLDLLIDQLSSPTPPEESWEVPTDYLLAAFIRELSSRKGRIALMFEKRLEACSRFAKDGSPYIQALLAISHGRHKVLAIATFLERKITETKNILQRLVQEDMVAKRGSFYVLEDPLFRFWLKHAYEVRNHCYTPDQEAICTGLKRSLREEFEQIERQERMDITARVEGLLKEFRNDVVEVDEKKFQCPYFSEIVFRPTNGRIFPLLARSGKTRWFCQIAPAPVVEEDVTAFLEELQRLRKKVQRKIMITLKGIDQNAKLMAQEAKIQLWNLRNFNALLDLYDLPKIITTDESQERGHDATDLGALAQSIHQT
ncbi:MAG: hypothetical protein NC930_01690 [Candidatus Omnitrophica bacterium]|nr:hypothetical protein [Candidatus Omnitrophota bacterium]